MEVEPMIKHQLKIVVSENGSEPISVAEFKRLPLFKRLSTKWFGKSQKVMVIIPEDSVQSIEIAEVDIKNDKQQNAHKSRAV